ncbi:MAG: TonB-dependent receptor [Sphingobacteriaceae bacterium]|nr:MAG: TonB-dependent receptor [Sphingobacteriaceae bacterium]
MKLKYTYTLLTLLMVLYFVPVIAQNKKPAAKPAPVKTAAQKTAEAKSLGDAAAKAAPKDTTKKAGANTANNPNSGSLTEEIVITSAYKPVLADAVKLRRNPELEDKVPFKAPLTYTSIDKKLTKDEEIKQLDAMKMPAEKDSILKLNYVKLGFGSLRTTFGEAYIANGRDEALQVGLYIKHFGQQGTIYKQNQLRNEIGIFGKSIGDKHTLSGRIDYSVRNNYFYGFDPNAPIPANFAPAYQRFNTISAEGELAKNYKDVENDFTYAVKLKGYLFSNALQGKENNIVLSGFLNQTVKQFYAGLSASMDVSTQNDVLYSLSNNLFRVNPYIKLQGTNYKVDAGVNLVSEFGFSSRLIMFPAAKAELQVIPKYVRLFVEAKGDINRSSLRDFSLINPFLGPNIAIKNSVDQLDVSAGLKGTLAPGLSFKGTIFRNTIKDMPLLVSNFDLANGYNRFAVIYDNGRARVTGLNAELDYKPDDSFNIFGRAEFRDYKMSTEVMAWNLPKFKLTAGTNIHINNKVNVSGSLLFRGNTNDPHLNGGTYSAIPSFVDISGGIDYKATNKISIFGRVNNILNGTNQTWLYYPEYGFNIFGGASYSF